MVGIGQGCVSGGLARRQAKSSIVALDGILPALLLPVSMPKIYHGWLPPCTILQNLGFWRPNTGHLASYSQKIENKS